MFYYMFYINKFLISEKFGIYAYTYIFDNESDTDNRSSVKLQSKTERIIIELYSYKSSIEIIKMFVEKTNDTPRIPNFEFAAIPRSTLDITNKLTLTIIAL